MTSNLIRYCRCPGQNLGFQYSVLSTQRVVCKGCDTKLRLSAHHYLCHPSCGSHLKIGNTNNQFHSNTTTISHSGGYSASWMTYVGSNVHVREFFFKNHEGLFQNSKIPKFSKKTVTDRFVGLIVSSFSNHSKNRSLPVCPRRYTEPGPPGVCMRSGIMIGIRTWQK